jgi:hypothetical protein
MLSRQMLYHLSFLGRCSVKPKSFVLLKNKYASLYQILSKRGRKIAPKKKDTKKLTKSGSSRDDNYPNM